MSDFWARKLAQQQAPEPPPQQAPPVAWWQPPQVSQAVTPQPSQPPATPQYGSGTPQDGQSHIGDLLRRQNYLPDPLKVKSQNYSDNCPECGSGNYFTPPGGRLGTPAPRCADCGHNPLFQQTMSGVSGIGQNIPVQTARVQTNTPPPGFGRIGSIIGHV